LTASLEFGHCPGPHRFSRPISGPRDPRAPRRPIRASGRRPIRRVLEDGNSIRSRRPNERPTPPRRLPLARPPAGPGPAPATGRAWCRRHGPAAAHLSLSSTYRLITSPRGLHLREPADRRNSPARLRWPALSLTTCRSWRHQARGCFFRLRSGSVYHGALVVSRRPHVGPFSGAESLRTRFLRRFRLARTVEGDRLANERLEGRLVNFFSFVDVDRWRTFPSRLELKRRAGSFRDAPLAKVSFTTAL